MTILELLKTPHYPGAWIQGHHTRITLDENGKFTVYSRECPDSSSSGYFVEHYQGDDEQSAVSYFANSENN